jgi:hypothetical protein
MAELKSVNTLLQEGTIAVDTRASVRMKERERGKEGASEEREREREREREERERRERREREREKRKERERTLPPFTPSSLFFSSQTSASSHGPVVPIVTHLRALKAVIDVERVVEAACDEVLATVVKG